MRAFTPANIRRVEHAALRVSLHAALFVSLGCAAPGSRQLPVLRDAAPASPPEVARPRTDELERVRKGELAIAVFHLTIRTDSGDRAVDAAEVGFEPGGEYSSSTQAGFPPGGLFRARRAWPMPVAAGGGFYILASPGNHRLWIGGMTTASPPPVGFNLTGSETVIQAAAGSIDCSVAERCTEWVFESVAPPAIPPLPTLTTPVAAHPPALLHCTTAVSAPASSRIFTLLESNSHELNYPDLSLGRDNLEPMRCTGGDCLVYILLYPLLGYAQSRLEERHAARDQFIAGLDARIKGVVAGAEYDPLASFHTASTEANDGTGAGIAVHILGRRIALADCPGQSAGARATSCGSWDRKQQKHCLSASVGFDQWIELGLVLPDGAGSPRLNFGYDDRLGRWRLYPSNQRPRSTGGGCHPIEYFNDAPPGRMEAEFESIARRFPVDFSEWLRGLSPPGANVLIRSLLPVRPAGTAAAPRRN